MKSLFIELLNDYFCKSLRIVYCSWMSKDMWNLIFPSLHLFPFYLSFEVNVISAIHMYYVHLQNKLGLNPLSNPLVMPISSQLCFSLIFTFVFNNFQQGLLSVPFFSNKFFSYHFLNSPKSLIIFEIQ